MLHHIRASVRKIRREASLEVGSGAHSVERCLANLLKHAMVARSPFDIAVVLGSAAELMMFPDEVVLAQCTETVQLADQRALRGVVWAVRHRCVRAGNRVHRFALG